jgi:hypothetical protein
MLACFRPRSRAYAGTGRSSARSRIWRRPTHRSCIAFVAFVALIAGRALSALRTLRASLSLGAGHALNALRALRTGRALCARLTLRPRIPAAGGE